MYFLIPNFLVVFPFETGGYFFSQMQDFSSAEGQSSHSLVRSSNGLLGFEWRLASLDSDVSWMS